MKQSDDKRRLIIGAPLMLIVVFCFGFFLMHPRNEADPTAVSDTTATKQAPADSSTSASQLSSLPKAETATPPPASATTANDNSSPAVSSSQPTEKSPVSNTQTSNSQTKEGVKHNKAAASNNNQDGLIQTVVNGLLNGR